MLSVIAGERARAELHTDLDELAREAPGGCWRPRWKPRTTTSWPRMRLSRDERGRRLVVRNGHARQRDILTAAGAVRCRRPGSTTAESTR